MLDAKGRLIRLGNRVSIGKAIDGVVVFSIDPHEFSTEFFSEWVLEREKVAPVYLRNGRQFCRVGRDGIG
jgi:hypothetical protein